MPKVKLTVTKAIAGAAIAPKAIHSSWRIFVPAVPRALEPRLSLPVHTKCFDVACPDGGRVSVHGESEE